MPSVRFAGGPCAGQTKTLSAATIAAGEVKCGGQTYTLLEGSTGTFLAIFGASADLAPVSATAPKASRAWRHLVHGLVVTAPRDLRRAQAARRHIARIGRRA